MFGASYNYTITTSPLSIKVSGTKTDGSSVGADLVADITTLLSEVKLVPPEDYSGTSTITASVTGTLNQTITDTAVITRLKEGSGAISPVGLQPVTFAASKTGVVSDYSELVPALVEEFKKSL